MDIQKTPGPDHPIHIAATKGKVRARYLDRVIADSDGALMLAEAGYRAVAYLPRGDVAFEWFSRSDRRTHCPYKGYASYFNVLMDGQLAENAAWSYEDPYPAMEAIRGMIAFYPHPVEVYEVEAHPGAVSPDEVVLHTDDGEGRSQQQHWAPNTTDPSPPR